MEQSYVYKIYNRHDFGDQSVYVESNMPLDQVIGVCRYIERKGEYVLSELGFKGQSISNFAMAAVLIAHYHCVQGSRASYVTHLDRYEMALVNPKTLVTEFRDPKAIETTLRLFCENHLGISSDRYHIGATMKDFK